LETEVKNYGPAKCTATVCNRLLDAGGNLVAKIKSEVNLSTESPVIVKQLMPDIKGVHLWSLQDPYLYTILSQVIIKGKVTDQTSISYGIRWISWPIGRNNGDNRFLLNGKPVFINGVAEYEHLMGKSHAFSNEEIRARVMQLRAAGFNAFRDAHQPHNLEYHKYWDKLGLLWWPQYSAHIWFDTPGFRNNYKTLLRDWIKERRNSPSVILWGLQNESKLPEDFARQCTAIIRSLDPTASSQRKIVTCNGGKGTDWDVPQNWTGTYGGDPLTYAEDLKKQILVGEYGAWRSLDLHTEGPFVQNGVLSEDRMSQLLETKVRLAESVKDKAAGQFNWLLYSHENPGRVQGGEGYRELDRVGPVNYKGLFTVWGQPLDAFYMYRANYTSKQKEPMVYIVSHTWPNRWLKPGIKDSINVYSNCDEVELFNDVNAESLGRRTRNGIGTHFQWNKADIKFNVLYAVGYVNGKAVAKDYIVLNHLPSAPHLKLIKPGNLQILKPADGYKYLYRVNCGGPDYQDKQGNLWMADVHQDSKTHWGSQSWTDDYPGLPPFYASQQRTFDPIQSTDDSKLFQSFRFGMDRLKYNFPVPDGDYRVELFFTEPWYGAGGGLDCVGWRIFDIAVNNKTVIKNLDIWKEAGYDHALKKTVNVRVTGGLLQISFPDIEAGEAVISAIAISTLNHHIVPAAHSIGMIRDLKITGSDAKKWSVQSWMDIGARAFTDANTCFSQLPPVLYGADWIRAPAHAGPESNTVTFETSAACDIYIATTVRPDKQPGWLKGFEATALFIQTDESGSNELPVYKKRFVSKAMITLGPFINGNRYTIAALPITTLEPATDLKRTVSYKAEKAVVTGSGILKDTLAGKQVLRFNKSSGGSIIFEIAPGVADKYTLRFKYYNSSKKTFIAGMQLQAADGTVMKSEVLYFKPTQRNKSGTIETTTSTSINAGNYKIIITAIDADGLIISGLEVQ